MKMKVIALGMLSMFLLASIVVGAVTGDKNSDTNNTSSKADLQVELYGWGKNEKGGYAFLGAKVTNIGDSYTAGQIDLYLSKKGLFGLIPRPIQRTLENTVWKLKWTICEYNEWLAPGESVYTGDYHLSSMGGGGLFCLATYQYTVTPSAYEDNFLNNVASQRVKQIFGHMYFI